MRRFILKIFIIFLLLASGLVWFNFIGTGPENKNIIWGVTFSAEQAEYLNLSWQKVYTGLLDDLRVKNFRLISAWDVTEPEKGKFDFSIIDWQLEELHKRQGRAIVTLGLKVPRWPECHIPSWAKEMSKEQQQEEVIKYLKESVRHLSKFGEIAAWQIENEPFLNFGECPWKINAGFLKREISSVKAIDSRPVVVTGSGEWATLFSEARLGDIVGTTLYQRVFFGPLNVFLGYPFSSASYARKAWLVKNIFGKDVIDVELQAEPWSKTGLINATKEDDDKTFTIKDFQTNVEFASRTGHKEVYLWGAEWWYFMKELEYPEYLDEAKKVFQTKSQ